MGRGALSRALRSLLRIDITSDGRSDGGIDMTASVEIYQPHHFLLWVYALFLYNTHSLDV
jgi:hypothetical protein